MDVFLLMTSIGFVKPLGLLKQAGSLQLLEAGLFPLECQLTTYHHFLWDILIILITTFLVYDDKLACAEFL